jgi:mono/diheme cytochrome c family protein
MAALQFVVYGSPPLAQDVATGGEVIASLKRLSNRRPVQMSTGVTFAVILGVLALASPHVALAQAEAKVTAGLEVWKSSGCSDCHGGFANGEKDRDESPTGANLRTARLDDAELKKAISCGRPGADMPAFDRGASACSGDGGGGELYPAPRTLTSAEVDALVAYLRARIVGRGRITKAECLAYYDNQEEMCGEFQ